jgi:hypothetical protein
MYCHALKCLKQQAIQINILIMKTFIKMRSVKLLIKTFQKIDELEKRVSKPMTTSTRVSKTVQQLVIQEQKPKPWGSPTKNIDHRLSAGLTTKARFTTRRSK